MGPMQAPMQPPCSPPLSHSLVHGHLHVTPSPIPDMCTAFCLCALPSPSLSPSLSPSHHPPLTPPTLDVCTGNLGPQAQDDPPRYEQAGVWGEGDKEQGLGRGRSTEGGGGQELGFWRGRGGGSRIEAPARWTAFPAASRRGKRGREPGFTRARPHQSHSWASPHARLLPLRHQDKGPAPHPTLLQVLRRKAFPPSTT